MPKICSSAAICTDTFGWLTPSACAAWEKLLASATAMKVLSPASVIPPSRRPAGERSA